MRKSQNAKKLKPLQPQVEEANFKKPPPPQRDYLKEFKSKREQQMLYQDGGSRHRMIHGMEIDKVLRNQNMSDAEKYNLLRIKTDQLE